MGRKIIPVEWEEMMQNDANGDGTAAALPSAPKVQAAQPAVAEPPNETPESCQAEEHHEDNPIAAEW
jgi:hypothetical protein